MKGSALFRHPPNNQDDYFIIKGFVRQSGLPDYKIHPDKVFPFINRLMLLMVNEEQDLWLPWV